MPRKPSLEQHLQLTAPLISGAQKEKEEDRPRGLSGITTPAPAPAPALAPALAPTPTPAPDVPRLETQEPDPTGLGPLAFIPRESISDPIEFNLQKKTTGFNEGMRYAGENALYSREFRERLQEGAGVIIPSREAMDGVADVFLNEFMKNPEGAEDSFIWEKLPPEVPVLAKGGGKTLAKRTGTPWRLTPLAEETLRYWSAAKMGAAYMTEDSLRQNFIADYEENSRSEDLQRQEWAETPKTDLRLGIAPDGTLIQVERSEDADANKRMGEHVEATAARTVLLDTTDKNDDLLAMSLHTMGLTEDFVADLVGEEEASEMMNSPYARVAPEAHKKGVPLVEILYSEGGVPGKAIRKQYNRLYAVNWRNNLLGMGIDPRGKNADEISDQYGHDKVLEAKKAAQKEAHEWWERNVHQNEAPVVYFGNYDREGELKEQAETGSWKEGIGQTKIPIAGPIIDIYLNSPAYKATYAPNRPAFAARYKDFPLEDVESARAIELGWQKLGAPGVGKAVDVGIRAGSLTQQIGAALDFAKREADEKHASGDPSAMRTDKIFKRAWEVWNTPEHVENIIRMEDGTGYLIHELGNYLGGRAISGADQWYKVDPVLGGVAEGFVAMMPGSGQLTGLGLLGPKMVINAVTGRNAWDALPRYVEDFGVSPHTGEMAWDAPGPLKFARYMGGVSDELPGWGAATFLDVIDLGQPLNLAFLGPGWVRAGIKSVTKEGMEKGAVLGPAEAVKTWRTVLDGASPEDTSATLLERARDLDTTKTGDVDALFAAMQLEVMGSGQVLEGNLHTHHRLLQNLNQLEKNLGDDMVEALTQGRKVLDTEKNIEELVTFIDDAVKRQKALIDEVKAQEALRKMLDKSRLATEGAEAPVATQKAVDKVRKEIDELVAEMDSLRSEGKDITAVQNKLRKKGEQFDEMSTALRAQELEAAKRASETAGEALDAAATVTRLEGEIADLARQRDALKAKPAKEVVEEAVEEAAPPLRDPHQQDLHWDGPVPKGSTPEERIRPLMERLRAEQKKHGPYDDDIHFRAFPWKSIDGMAQLRKDLAELSKREPKGSKHQRGLKDVDEWIYQEHGRGRTPLPDTAPQVVEPVAAFVDDFFKKYPSPTKKAPKKAPKKTAKPDKALAGVEAKIVAAEKELVAARKAAEAAPKAAPAKEVAEAVVKEEPARVVLLDEIRAAVPKKAPDGRPIQFGDGPFSDINRAIYVSATQPSTKIGRTAIAWLESIGITRADQKVYRALMRKEVATAPKAFSSITVIGAKNLKGNIDNFRLSRKGNRAVVKQRQRLKSFLAPPKKPKAPPKAAKVKKEPPPPLALTAENLAQTMAKNPKLRAQVEKAAANRLKNRARTEAYFKRVSAASKKLGVALKEAAEKGTKKAKAQAIRAQKELAKAIGNKEEFLVRMLSRQSDTLATMQTRLGNTIAEARNSLRIAERAREGLDPKLVKELLEIGGRDFEGAPIDMALARDAKQISKDAAFLQAAVDILQVPVTLAEKGRAGARKLMRPFYEAAEKILDTADSISAIRNDPDFVKDLRGKIKTGVELEEASSQGRVLDALMILGRDDPDYLPSVARFLGMTDDEIGVALKGDALQREVANRWAIRDFLMRQWTEIAPRDVNAIVYGARALKTMYSRGKVSKPMWGAYISRVMAGFFSKQRPFFRSHRFLAGMGEDLGLLTDRISRRQRIQYSDLAKLRNSFTPLIRGLDEGADIRGTELYDSLVSYVTANESLVMKSLGKKLADRLGIEGDTARAFFGRDTMLLGRVQEESALIDDAWYAFELAAMRAKEMDYAKVPTDIQGVHLFVHSLLRFSGTPKEVSAMTKKVEAAFFKILNNEKNLMDEVIADVGSLGDDIKYRQLVEAVRRASIMAAEGEAWKPVFISPLQRLNPGDVNFHALRDSIEVIARTSLEIDAIKRTFAISGGMYSRSNQQALAAYYDGPNALKEFLSHRNFAPNDVVVLSEDAIKLENLTKDTLDSLSEAAVGKLNPMLDQAFARSFFIDSIDNEAQTVIVVNTSNPAERMTVALSDIAYRPPAFTFLDFYDSSIAYGTSFAPSIKTTPRQLDDPRFLGAVHDDAKLKLLEYITLHIGPNGTSRPVLRGVRDEALAAITGRNRALGAVLQKRIAGQETGVKGAVDKMQDSVAGSFVINAFETLNDYWKIGVLYGWSVLSIRPDRPMEIFIDDTLNTFVSPGAGTRANLLESFEASGRVALYGTLGQVPVIGDGLARVAQQRTARAAQKGKVSLPPAEGVHTDPILDRILSGDPNVKVRTAEGKISAKQMVREMVEDGIDDNIRSEDGLNSMVRLLGREPESYESAWTRPSFRDDISSSPSFSSSGNIPTGTAGRVWNGVKMGVKRTVGPNNAATRWMDGHIRNITMRQRAQLYLHLRSAKNTPRNEARRITLEALYDWDLATTGWFERHILKRAFPWYTWQKNLMMQMGNVLMESGTMPMNELAGRWITGRTRAQRLALAYRQRQNAQYQTLTLDESMDEQQFENARFAMKMPSYYDKYGILGTYTVDYKGRERGAYEQANWGYSPPLMGLLEGYEAYASIGLGLATLSAIAVSGADTYALKDDTVGKQVETVIKTMIDQMMPRAGAQIGALLGVGGPRYELIGSEVRLNKAAYLSLSGYPFQQDEYMRPVIEEGVPTYYMWKPPKWMDNDLARGLGLDMASFTVGNSKVQYSRNLEATGLRKTAADVPGIGYLLGMERDPAMKAILDDIEAAGGDKKAYMFAIAQLAGIINVLSWDGKASLYRETDIKLREASREATAREKQKDARAERMFGDRPTDVPSQSERLGRLLELQQKRLERERKERK